MFKLTDEQQAIIDATANTKENILIQAYAGAAKTTTLTFAAQQIKVPGLAVAFNRSIKEELAKRFPGNFVIQTMNGLGYQAMMRAMPAIKFTLDQQKLGRIIMNVLRDYKTEMDSDERGELRNYVSQIMQQGIVPDDRGTPILADTKENWEKVADVCDIMESDRDYYAYLAREIISRSIEEAEKGNINFDDQVYVSSLIFGKFPQFPVLFVDEAQDLSPLNHMMIQKAVRPDGRLVICGDALQSIYAFRGADVNSIQKIKALRPQWLEFPLTVTFRCPKKIVERQLGHAMEFKAAEENAEGAFVKLPATPIDLEGNLLYWNWDDVAKLANGKTIGVLCRNNAPLMSLVFILLAKKIGVNFLGRDIASNLIALSNRIFSNPSATREEMQASIIEWRNNELYKLSDAKDNDKSDVIIDRADCLIAVLEGNENIETANDLRIVLRNLVKTDAGNVTLATVHKAKGLEWDTVVFLDPWRIPSKFATAAAKKGDKDKLKQEYNIRYVAETRTKNILIHASMKAYKENKKVLVRTA